MESKPFRLGVIVGRFQPLHIGHEDMINKAVSLCETVCVLVGSSDESGNSENPFTYGEREELLRKVYGNRIDIYPLPDIFIGSSAKWGNYVLESVRERYGVYPDVFVSGREDRRSGWFTGEKAGSVGVLFVPKQKNISAKEIRAYLQNGLLDEWKKQTNPLIWDKYEDLRKTVLDSKDNHGSRNV